MGFQIFVAATKNDWIELFARANGGEQLRFYANKAAQLDSIVPLYLNDIPNLGHAQSGIQVQEPCYLALPATEPVVPREIRQTNGVIRYSIDQPTNPDSFSFWPCGLWKDDWFIISEMNSAHQVGRSLDVVKKMRSIMRRTFEYNDLCWIGPECRRLYSRRAITTDYRYPSVMDYYRRP